MYKMSAPRIPLPPSSLTGITFSASITTLPSGINIFVGTKTIPLEGLSLGHNSVQITNADASILSALTNLVSGKQIINYLTCSYANGASVDKVTGTTYVLPPPLPPTTE